MKGIAPPQSFFRVSRSSHARMQTTWYFSFAAAQYTEQDYSAKSLLPICIT